MDKLIVAMNKVDMFPPADREQMIQAQTKKLQTRFAFTRFGAEIPIVPVSACPRQEETKDAEEVKNQEPIGIESLINTILNHLTLPQRKVSPQDPFLFSIDHCF